MLTTRATTTTSATPATVGAVDRFLDAVRGGTGVPADVLAPGAVLDATVPGWRFTVRGAQAVARQYRGWFDHPGRLEELERRRTDDGEVLTYLLNWVEGGVPHAARHCHVLTLDAGGRIAVDRFFCGGRWDAALLAEMAAADDAG
ncbi:MAG TPA: hypothetical protein VM263_10250 [Acidimicrobiales bacterium]|nr:hypothetical protein [Acidimicrobiales bacterium]